jgi:hypothetical protein
MVLQGSAVVYVVFGDNATPVIVTVITPAAGSLVVVVISVYGSPLSKLT